MKSAALVWRYLKPSGWLCLGAAVLVLAEANCELLLPALMSTVIGKGVRENDLALILHTGVQMALAALAGILCVLGRNLCSGTASQRFGAALRRALFAKLPRLSEAGADRLGDGGLVTRVLSDSDQLAKSVNSALCIGIKTPLMCLGSVFYALRLDGRASVVVALVVVLVLALIVGYMRLSSHRFQRVCTAMDQMNTAVQEFLRGIRLVKALGLEGDQGERFQAANGELVESSIRLQILPAWFSPLITLAVHLGLVVLLGLAGLWGIETGKVSALVAYMTRLLGSLMTLIDVFKLLIRANTAAVRVQEVLDLPEDQEPEHPAAAGTEGPALEFRGVGFAYPGSARPILQDISFRVERGEMLAVVGPTGSGKSTLASLCARLYEPGAGKILLHGTPLHSLSLEDIRRRVAMAGGRGWLFSGTVRKNLSMAAPEAGEEDLWSALEDAQASAFVSRAGGLDAPVEQGGVNFSGGQRQRLLLAQVFLRNSEVLILDGYTSALDPPTEGRVLEAVQRRGQTVVLITQRLRCARQAGRILVLENGRMLGLGRHGELLRSCPVYREMWRAQSWEEESDEVQR